MELSKSALYISVLQDLHTIVQYTYDISTDYELEVHQALSVIIVKKGRFILPKNGLTIYSLCGDPEPKNFAYNLVVQRDYNKTVAFQILEHLKQNLSTHFLQNLNS